MAISTNGGSNPTSVIYNGNNVNEVWYKSSPSATAVKVWPDEAGLKLKFVLGRFYSYSGSSVNKTPTLSPRLYIVNYDGAYWFKDYTFVSWHRENGIPIADKNYDEYSYTFDKDMLDASGTSFNFLSEASSSTPGSAWAGALYIDGVLVNGSTSDINTDYKLYWNAGDGWTVSYYPEGHTQKIIRKIPTLHTIEMYTRDLETGEELPTVGTWHQRINLLTK